MFVGRARRLILGGGMTMMLSTRKRLGSDGERSRAWVDLIGRHHNCGLLPARSDAPGTFLNRPASSGVGDFSVPAKTVSAHARGFARSPSPSLCRAAFDFNLANRIHSRSSSPTICDAMRRFDSPSIQRLIDQLIRNQRLRIDKRF